LKREGNAVVTTARVVRVVGRHAHERYAAKRLGKMGAASKVRMVDVAQWQREHGETV
jgi:hypothetical protein